jgi:hypothetical protein
VEFGDEPIGELGALPIARWRAALLDATRHGAHRRWQSPSRSWRTRPSLRSGSVIGLSRLPSAAEASTAGEVFQETPTCVSILQRAVSSSDQEAGFWPAELV